MAITYPGTIDVFTNPSGSNTQDNPDHAVQHSDANDAIEALEAVVGTTAGTNVLKNFAAGNFPARINSTNVLQQALSGTINNSVLGTPAISGGTINGGAVITSNTLGTNTITGGTISMSVGTLNNMVMGSPSITGISVTGGTINAPVIYGGWGTASDAGTVTFNVGTCSRWEVTLGGNRTLAVSGPSVGQAFVLRLVQDATGTRTVSWSMGTIKWAGGAAPTLTVTAGKADMIGFIETSAANYDGFIVGKNL